MCGHTMSNTTRNENIQDKVGVTSMKDKRREARLKWLRRVKRRCVDTPMRRSKRLDIVGIGRDRGRSKKY